MAVTITWPRHPRAGCSANSARATTISGKYWVQLRNTSNTYVNAMQVTTLKRAQDIAKQSRYEKDVGHYIPKLVDPKDSCYTGNSRDVQATYYGCGDMQPNVTTANNDIFHCCDLTVARPDSLEKALPLNTWVKITNKNNGRSVVARVTDTCPTAALDLTAGGVAYALNCYNGTITISKP